MDGGIDGLLFVSSILSRFDEIFKSLRKTITVNNITLSNQETRRHEILETLQQLQPKPFDWTVEFQAPIILNAI